METFVVAFWLLQTRLMFVFLGHYGEQHLLCAPWSTGDKF